MLGSMRDRLGMFAGRGMRVAVAVGCIAVGLGVFAPPASATIGQITGFQTQTGGSPRGVTLGPDGNVWFTECDTGTLVYGQDHAHRHDHRVLDAGQLLPDRDHDRTRRGPLVR